MCGLTLAYIAGWSGFFAMAVELSAAACLLRPSAAASTSGARIHRLDNAAAEGGSKQAAAEQLHRHHEKTRPALNQVRQRSPHHPLLSTCSVVKIRKRRRPQPLRCGSFARNACTFEFPGSKRSPVNTQELTEIHAAPRPAVHDTVGTLTFPRCDQDDLFELIDRVETEFVLVPSEHSDHRHVPELDRAQSLAPLRKPARLAFASKTFWHAPACRAHSQAGI